MKKLLLRIPGIKERQKRILQERLDHYVPLLIDWVEPLSKVLDFGCGRGYFSKYLHAEKSIAPVLTDVEDMRDKEAVGKFPFFRFDGQELLLPSDSFTTVLLIDVLHHCPDPKQILREAKRVATQNIIVIEQTPSNFWARSWLQFIDRLLSWSWGRETLKFRSQQGWVEIFKSLGLAVIDEKETIYNPFLLVSFPASAFLLKK
ncbi:class I SAM-dependent methyltransferase [Patescibacteria group bacterium]